MAERHFHHKAHEHVEKEIEVITLQGNFTGRLIEVQGDILVLETRGRMRPVILFIRIETVVAIYQVEPMPMGPFGFNPGGGEFGPGPGPGPTESSDR